MKITVISNGIVKVEGSSLAEEIEMRNKLQAQGKPCTPIEYEGSLQDCLDWIMGKSESELDEVEDEDYNTAYEIGYDDGYFRRPYNNPFCYESSESDDYIDGFYNGDIDRTQDDADGKS